MKSAGALWARLPRGLIEGLKDRAAARRFGIDSSMQG